MSGASAQSWTAASLTKRLRALGNQPHREVVEELFTAHSGLQLNVVHFNVAAAASTCPWFAASWLFSRALCIQQDVISYSTEMKAGLGQAPWPWATSLMEKAAKSQAADLVTWTTAVSCTRCDGPWPFAQTLLSSCAAAALCPDVALLAAVQSATTRWAAALERLRVAKLLKVGINATELQADLLDPKVASRLPHHHAQRPGRRVAPAAGPAALCQPLAELAASGECRGERSRESGMATKPGAFEETLPRWRLSADVITFNSLVDGCRGELWKQVSKFLEEMGLNQLRQNQVTINVAMASLTQSSRWAEALYQAGAAPHTKLFLDPLGARGALVASAQAARWSLALEFLQLSLASRILDRPSHSAAARTAARARQWQWSRLAFVSRAQGHDPAQDLAEMAWLGAQHGRWEQPWSSVAEALVPKLMELDLQEFSTVLWSFATLGLRSSSFLKAASDEAMHRLHGGQVAVRPRSLSAVTPRILADLAWSLVCMGSIETEVYSQLQQHLARMVSKAGVASSPQKLLKDLINKSLVVVWACSFIGVLHASLYHVLAEKFASFAEVLASSPCAPESQMAGHANGDSANSPSIVLDLPDKLVVHKPASWQVDHARAGRTWPFTPEMC
eukprot:s21_g22.t1